MPPVDAGPSVNNIYLPIYNIKYISDFFFDPSISSDAADIGIYEKSRCSPERNST